MGEHDGQQRFRVGAYIGGAGFGRLTVARGTLAFDPGRITRLVLGLKGRLEHRAERLVVVESPLMFFGVHIVLRASPAQPSRSRLLARRSGDVRFAALSIYPWQRRRVLSAIRGAGFDVQIRWRWIYFGVEPID
jgi:hypothetical protein